jgi:hypothetical membrane protein
MRWISPKVAGSLVLIGAAQFIVAMMIAEALYRNYSIRDNYISDLGVGPSALVFNSSVILLGLLAAAASYIIYRSIQARPLALLILLSGIGAIGVGIFTENAGQMHAVVSAVAFIFGGISAIAAYKLEKVPLNYISTILGLTALVALALFGTRNFLDLGAGGMERMIAYPILLWAVAFGAHLIGIEGKQ